MEEEQEEVVEAVGEIADEAVRRPPPPLCSVLMEVITEASLGQSVVSVRQQDCCSMLGVRVPPPPPLAARPTIAR